MFHYHPTNIQITYDNGSYWVYYCEEDGKPIWTSELGGDCLGLETAQDVLNFLPKLMLKLEATYEGFVAYTQYTEED